MTSLADHCGQCAQPLPKAVYRHSQKMKWCQPCQKLVCVHCGQLDDDHRENILGTPLCPDLNQDREQPPSD